MNAACCSGTVDQGTPSGVESSVCSINCYTAGTLSLGNPVVVVATDIFGYKLPNARLLADKFAAKGFYAVVPDLFCGTEPDADVMDDLLLLNDAKAPFLCML